MKPIRLRPLPPDPSFTWAPNRPCLINHPSQMRKLLGVIASSDAITGSDLVTIRPASPSRRGPVAAVGSALAVSAVSSYVPE